MTTRARRRSGFTLTELMVSLAVLGVVSLYLTDMLLRQSRTYTVVDSMTEVQQNVRAIGELIEREARVTGFLVPEGASYCGFDSTNRADIVFLTDSDALRFDDDDVSTYNLGARIVAGFTAAGTNTLSVSSVILDDIAFYDNSTPPDGIADADFRPGAGVIVMDRNNPSRGTACGIISNTPSAVTPTTIANVDFTLGGVSGSQALAAIPVGGNTTADLVAVPAHVYQVNANNQLLRDGRVIADDVEDLQVAVFVDADDDDTLDLPQEYLGASAGWMYDPTGVAHDLVRELRLNFVVRSRAADPDFQLAGAGEFQRTENRAAVAGTDGFRRRVYTATVRPRNVGLRKAGGTS